MSHYLALVLVERNEEGFEGKVRELMYAYAEYYEVAPYKDYLDEKYSKRAVEEHGLSVGDFQTIAEVLSAMLKEDISFDDHGVYAWSTRNPKAKYDGFRIGGQYDGDIWGKEQHYNLTPAEYTARYGLDVVRPEDNVRPVAELRPGLLPYAVVTPDGQWHDCKGMEDAQWEAELSALLQQYSDHLAVAIDCHC